jgi:uncharacterized integral membrane protein
MNRQVRTILITTLATLVVVLMLQNMRSVTLRFVVWEIRFPLVLLLPLIFGAGVFAGRIWRRR